MKLEECSTRDRRLERRILCWRISVELYTALIVTFILVVLLKG